MTTGRARLLAALAAAHVRFVMLEGSSARRLRLVVWSHPTNLSALGRVLDGVGATLLPLRSPSRVGARRIGGHGMMRAHVPGTDVELLIGGPAGTLYEDISEGAHSAEVDGVEVKVASAPAAAKPQVGSAGSVMASRLLNLADILADQVPAAHPAPE